MKKDYEYYQIITEDGLKDNAEQSVPKKRNSKERYLYRYRGPIKRYGKVVIEYFDETTLAVSAPQAANNILFRAKHALDLSRTAGGLLLVNRVERIEEV